MKLFIIALTVLSVVCEDESLNQMSGHQFQQQNFAQNGEQHLNFRSGAVSEKSHSSHSDKTVIVEHPSGHQVFKVESPQHPENVIVLSGEHSGGSPVVISSGHHHNHHNEEEVVEIEKPGVVVDEHHHHNHHNHHKECHIFRRKGICTPIPKWFGCIFNRGALTPAISECRLGEACCVQNVFTLS